MNLLLRASGERRGSSFGCALLTTTAVFFKISERSPVGVLLTRMGRMGRISANIWGYFCIARFNY